MEILQKESLEAFSDYFNASKAEEEEGSRSRLQSRGRFYNEVLKRVEDEVEVGIWKLKDSNGSGTGGISEYFLKIKI